MTTGRALLTNLYQLTMLQDYFERGMRDVAVFELFVRRLPFAGTSNLLAGERFGIPTFGTMAHSFVEAHDDEVLGYCVTPRSSASLI